MNQAQIAATVALAAMKTSVEVLVLLAKAGAVSPADVERLSEDISTNLHRLPAEALDRAEEMFAGPLARAKLAATANWTGG